RRAVPAVLEGRRTDALGQGAHNLAVDEQRVDRVAAVVHGDETFEPDSPGLAVHADHRDAGAEGEGGQVLSKEHRGFESRSLVRWQAHSSMSEFGDAVPSDHPLKHALHVKPAAYGLEILAARLEKPGRQPLSFLAHLDRGPRERAAAEPGAPASERPDRLGRSERIAVPDDDVLVRDAKVIGNDLGERRLVPLAVRA